MYPGRTQCVFLIIIEKIVWDISLTCTSYHNHGRSAMRTDRVTTPSLYVTGVQSFYSLRPSPAAMPGATNVLWYRHDSRVLSEDF